MGPHEKTEKKNPHRRLNEKEEGHGEMRRGNRWGRSMRRRNMKKGKGHGKQSKDTKRTQVRRTLF
jgi:hypothetical protein